MAMKPVGSGALQILGRTRMIAHAATIQARAT
jgi:hypothetical protein